MSGQTDGGGDESTSDPWVSTVMGVSGFLGGFSLASVVVISAGPDNFRWPGAAALALTIASVLLLAAAQEAKRGARFDPRYKLGWRNVIWAGYHAGIVMLLVGLGAALPPRPGPSPQLGLRWGAMWIAFAAAAVEAALAFWAVVTRESDTSEGKPAGSGPP
jgi:hypothetical protein